jgi:hypothetical protein
MINTNLDSDKVLKEVKKILGYLRNNSVSLKNLKKAHTETLDFCRIIFLSKKSYKKIDISFPEEIKINVICPKAKRADKKLGFTVNTDCVKVLKENIHEILKKVKKIYSLKKKLEK